MREAAPTEQFWKAWRQNKDAVKAAGFSLPLGFSKVQSGTDAPRNGLCHDEWSVGFWSDSEDCPLPKPLS